MVQARRTERRWSRAFQHERSLRHQLQENLETLANQMHGLEDEARVSIGPVSPDKKMKASAKSQESLECDQSGDDDKFFDAPEMSVEEWKTVVADAAQSPSTDTEEERFILADTAAIKSSEASSKEKLPQIPLDKKMTVSDKHLPHSPLSHLPSLSLSNSHLSPYRSLMALLKASLMAVVLCQNVELEFLPNLPISLVFGPLSRTL